jgi:hypothetical protein
MSARPGDDGTDRDGTNDDRRAGAGSRARDEAGDRLEHGTAGGAEREAEGATVAHDVRRGRRRLKPLALLVLVLVLLLYVTRNAPHDQTVHLVFGRAAPRVTGVALRYARGEPDAEPVREADFAFDPGEAPRVLTHTPSLSNGDYAIEIEIKTKRSRAIVARRETLSGGSVSLDVAEAVPE